MAERDRKGRFVAGNKAGKGRPPKEYAESFSRVVSPNEWDKVVQRALAQALDGQHDARAWLAERLIGKTPQILELRAAEATLLAELLKHFEARGVSASEVFAAMIAQLVEEQSEVNPDER